MPQNRLDSYGKGDANDRANDLAASIFDEMPDEYKNDWRGFRDRVMGKRH